MFLAWTNQCRDGCCMVISKLHQFLYVYQLAFHCKEKLSLLSINLHQDGFPSSYLIYWVITCHCFYLFWYFRCPGFGQKEPFELAPMSCCYAPIMHWASPYFLAQKANLSLSCTIPAPTLDSAILQGVLVSLRGCCSDTKISVLDVCIVANVTAAGPQWAEPRNICIHIHMYVLISVAIYLIQYIYYNIYIL